MWGYIENLALIDPKPFLAIITPFLGILIGVVAAKINRLVKARGKQPS